MDNPIDIIGGEFKKIEDAVGVLVETAVWNEISKTAISRMIILHPDVPKYQTALDALNS